MLYNAAAGYSHCRFGSDSLIHRRNSSAYVLGPNRDADAFDSGDSTLSDLDESESYSGSGSNGSENSGSEAGITGDPNLPYPGIVPVTLKYLSQTTRPRSWCLALISNPWFERVSMMVILLNCITLGMYQPCVDKDPCSTSRCRILQKFDDFIFAFFSLEMTIKMIAMGVYGKGSYLADSWNRLDMFIVFAGAFEYSLPNFNDLNLSPVRTIRVLRPLRAINRIPSMRILVMLLLDTLPMLGNVLLLCFFVFFIFGIVGVQLWHGVLRQRCIFNRTLYPHVRWPGIPLTYKPLDTDYICSKSNHSGMHNCHDLPPFLNGSIECQLTWEEKQLPQYSHDDNYCINWNLYYTTCSDNNDNPFQNTISFDNIGLAWIAIFLVISLEGWTEIMYYVQDGHSFWDWVYFVLLIVIGSFFMINLCLVVIATQFSETKKREMERMRLERARFQSSSTLASSTNNSEPTSCYAEIVKYIAHICRRSKRRVLKKIRLYRVRRDLRRDKKISMGETIKLNHTKRHHPNCPKVKSALPQSACSTREVSRANSICLSDPEFHLRGGDDVGVSVVGLNQISAISNQDITTSHATSATNLLLPNTLQNNRRRSSVMFSDIILLHGQNVSHTASSTNFLSEHMDKKNVCSSEKTTQAGDGNIWQITAPTNAQEMLKTKQQIAEECSNLMNGEALTCQELLALGAINAALPTGPVVLDSFFDSLSKGITTRKKKEDYCCMQNENNEEDFSCCMDMWHCESEYKNEKRSKFYVCLCMIIKGFVKGLRMFRMYIKILVEHKLFQHSILLAILINTLSMGIEHHQQSDWLTHCVEVTNVIFSAVFAVEMLLKILAEGPFGYISNGFNVFDGVIVVLSAIEIFRNLTNQDGEVHTDSGLSVLRTFRLLRILKLVRFMPNLRRQLFVMLRTMDNVAIFFSLLILFIFIFSILGMNIFGCKFCRNKDREDGEGMCLSNSDDDKDRKNFDSLLWSLVTVFQILTQEDWNIVLSNGMARTSHWAALYFVALMTFGNYVLFNLLVAILVEGFSSERNERREREQRELARRKMSCILEANLKDSSEESSRSDTSGSSEIHCLNNKRNDWTSNSVDELRKVKNLNGQKIHRQVKCYDYNNKDCIIKEPKCNMQKESLLRHALKKPIPPIITHTAATPQDSPSNTLESEFAEFIYNINTNDDDKGEESTPSGEQLPVQNNSGLNLLKPPSPMTPPVTSRSVEKPIEDTKQPSRYKLLIHNEKVGYKTMSFSEKVVQIPSGGSPQSPENSGKLQSKMSWNLPRKPSLRRKVVKPESDETVPLNNGRDHSHCNGKGVTKPTIVPALTKRNSLNKSQNSLKQQNYNRISRENINKTPGQIELKPLNNFKNNLLLETNLTGSETTIKENNAKPFRLSQKLEMFIEKTGCLKGKDDYSLYLFSPENKFRRKCVWLVEQKYFDNIVLLFIAMNCITLAMERPNIPPDSPEKLFLQSCNYIFSIVFAFEMFVKVVATGMCYGPDAYFTSGWNIMDGALVIISIVDIIMFLINDTTSRIFGILRVFRLLRSLRPLRVINRAPGLKLVVQTLLSSLRPIGNIVLICCTFFIIFGILGVQLFKGTFYHCITDNVTGIIDKADCLASGHEWKNEKYNFDDLVQALMSLFVLSSRDGWVNIMYTGLDAVGVDKQPITNYNEWRLLYFISFILLVGFFVLNMFVGVVVENFHRCREEQEKEERVRRAAKRALQLAKRRRKMNEPPYYINYPSWRLFIHKIVTSKYFDLAIAAVIGLNVITMATESYKMPTIWEYVLRIFNYFFTAVFILESIMKLIALGFKMYVKDKWNILDIVIVILSVFGIIIEEMKENEMKIIPINPTIIRVLRVMRIARVLKLLKMAKGIRALLDTVMQALPQVGNLGLLFFLLFFIFAALGVELFGRLDCKVTPCQGLGEHAHFENFGMAFLTLFRVATGDNWNGIMKDTLYNELCNPTDECIKNCCISPIIAPIFFVIFVLMAQFVLVNVVVAVLMKHLEESHKHLEDEQDIDIQLEREFQEKQEQNERRALCLALQLDTQEFLPKKPKKPLQKVLSLPSNFTFNSPDTELNQNPTIKRQAPSIDFQTSPIIVSNMDDMRNIDDSLSDLYNIQEMPRNVKNDIHKVIVYSNPEITVTKQLEVPKKKPYQENINRLSVMQKSKHYGSSRHLLQKQASMDLHEVTPFIIPPPEGYDTLKIPPAVEKFNYFKTKINDSQESVQRIVAERRKLDEKLKEFDFRDIFNTRHCSEENIVDKYK
ncbi:voltage-dependent T-type calcium channel subunit alpha-1G-like isoform X2 [Anthonomus grandis grandis]|uniref:voltage-dependent T-type calcium channel subunit alpha-1G-like isoform X2 n=1 Tax=Anthonomus grandis grandis TaxID=2921223 RepID=UPI00216656B7|nr:voltage-dependent T-type calcium channel subunit alpha-1G-like isoform X2 [Anthonomus grandis grandis]